MSHEMIQVIILVKYLRQLHEMIKVKHKYLLTTVNKKKYKSKRSHEMMRCWIRIAVWSSLHEPVLIYGSSHGSVFKSPLYRVQNMYKSESPVTSRELTKWVGNIYNAESTLVHLLSRKLLKQ